MRSIKHKFYQKRIWLLNDIVNIDILTISETKLDSSFAIRQFQIHYFSRSYKFDRNSKGGGLLLYVRDGILSKLILRKVTIEGNQFQKKYALYAAHITPKMSLITEHLRRIDKKSWYIVILIQ